MPFLASISPDWPHPQSTSALKASWGKMSKGLLQIEIIPDDARNSHRARGIEGHHTSGHDVQEYPFDFSF